MKTVGAFAIFLTLPSLHFNSAPAWVFVLLGAVIGVIALLYYFAAGVGGEKDYWYGNPNRNYYLNIPPKWQGSDSGCTEGTLHMKVMDRLADSSTFEEKL